MSNHNDLDVPIGWLCADHLAVDLLVYADPGLSPACFEYRVTHSVLALTMFVGDVPLVQGRASARQQLASLRHRLTNSWVWGAWCAHSLHRLVSGAVVAESLRLARSTLRWLEGSRLVAQLDRTNGWGTEGAVRLSEGGVHVGVTRARRVLDVHLTQQ